MLANARYQLDVLATGYANIIGAAGEAAPLPLTPEQAQQAETDAVVRTVVEVAVVQPFKSTLNFLGSIAQALSEHPDIVLEMLGGIGGIVGGGALIVGGGGLEVVTVGVGTPAAVPAVAGGVALAGGGAALLGDSMTRLLNEAKTDRQPGVNRGDGRDDGGKWAPRDPDAPIPDYARKEQQGLDEVEEAVEQEVVRDKVNVNYPGSSQKGGRLYDGLYKNPDGTYTGIEVKSGSAWDKYWKPKVNTQRDFDDAVSIDNPAVGYYNGEEIQITDVVVKQVE